MSLSTMSVKLGDFLFAGLLNLNTYFPNRNKRNSTVLAAQNDHGLETCTEYTINGHLVRITSAQATVVRLSDNMPLAYATLHDLAMVDARDHADIVYHMYRAVSDKVRTI